MKERTNLPNLFEWQAEKIEEAARNLAFWVSATPEDRLSWQPKAEGLETVARTIYDQIHECSQVNRRFANVLRGIENGPWTENPPYFCSSEAESDLKASATELATVVKGLDDDSLDRDYPTGKRSMKGSFMISLALNNMYYHGGQVNLIQMLLGDGEFRFPTD